MRQSKRENKVRLGNYIAKNMGIAIDPDSIFDIQVKRIHAYKRQLLAAFKIMELYNLLREHPEADIPSYTFLFAGKAAAGYAFAKEVIQYICAIADLVNRDPVVSQKLRVIFLENFNVSSAQLIYPSADFSEQISTAGKEASGTGNMKFMFNGAVTLGTLDGANVEILNQVGPDNIAIFGLTAQEVMDYYTKGGYIAYDTCHGDPRLERICNQLVDGTFQSKTFYGIHDALLKGNDEYFVLKDFDAYMTAFRDLSAKYQDPQVWGKMSLQNIAMAGEFTSDRTIRQYCDDIWHAPYDKLK
jgi:starch phosphorylase